MVRSWNYNQIIDLNSDCLSVFVGSAIPSGGVDKICPGDRPVLCQVSPSTVTHNSLYSQTDEGNILHTAPISMHIPQTIDAGPSHYPYYPPPVYAPGYPYAYPGGYPIPVYPHSYLKDKKEGHNETVTILGPTETVTVNGLMTTLTLSGLERTITVKDVPSTLTLDAIVSTFTLENVPGTITKFIDAIPVTVTLNNPPATVTMVGTTTLTNFDMSTITLSGVETTITVLEEGPTVTLQASTVVVDGVPSTVTEIINGIPVTVTLDPIPTTVTQIGTSLITQVDVVTSLATLIKPETQFVTLPEVTKVLTLPAVAESVMLPAITQFVTLPASTIIQTSILTLPPNIVTSITTTTLAANTITLPSLPAVTVTIPPLPASTVIQTEIITLPANTVTLPGITVTLPGAIPSANTVTLVSTSVVSLLTFTSTVIATATATVINPVANLATSTVTLKASTITFSPSTVTIDPSTITLPGNIIPLPLGTITLPGSTFTLSPSIVTLSPNTVTLSPNTVTLLAPPASTVVLPAVTSTVVQLDLKQVTSTVSVPGSISTQFITVMNPATGAVQTVTQIAGGQVCPTVSNIFGGPQITYPGGFTFPFSIPNFSGPATYTLGPGNTIKVDPNGSYSYLNGAIDMIIGTPTQGSSFTFPFSIPSFTGPGLYTLAPNNVVSVDPNGQYTLLSGQDQGPTMVDPVYTITFASITLPTLSLPTLDLGNGFRVANYLGANIYTLDPNNIVSIGTNGDYSFIIGGNGNTRGSVTLPSVTLPTLTLAPGIALPTYTGPGVYTYTPGNVVSIAPLGGVSWLQGGPQLASSGGFIFPSFTFPIITVPSLTVPSLTVPIVTIPTISLPSVTLPSISLPQITLPSISLPQITLPSISLPGITLPSITLPSISLPQITLPSVSLPQTTLPSISLPQITLPTLNLGNGLSLPSYNGPGIYTLYPSNVVSIGTNSVFSFLTGNINGISLGTVSIPSLSLPTLSLPSGINIPNYSGPGIYTPSPGNVLSIGPFGGISWLQGGPQTTSGGEFGFPSLTWPPITLPTFNLPSISLPTVTLPSINLGGSLSVPSFSGPGVYTINSDHIISIASNGVFTYLSGSGFLGGKDGTLSLPSVSLPTLTLSGGIPISNFAGPGIYTVLPGNVLSINSQGGITWLQGGPQSLFGGGFTLPGFTLPTASLPSYTVPPISLLPITFPFVSLPTRIFPSVVLPINVPVPSYTGPGIYTVGPNSVVSIDPSGTYSYLTGSGFLGIKTGNIALPTVSLPTLTLGGGLQLPSYTGPGLYTPTPSNVISINSNGLPQWVSGGPLSLSSFVPTSVALPTITYPAFDLPIGGHIASYSGPGLYTLNSNTVVSVGPGGAYSYVSGSGFFGMKTGSATFPTISYPSLSLFDTYRIPTYAGPGVYTLSPGNIVSVDLNGLIQWLAGGPLNVPFMLPTTTPLGLKTICSAPVVTTTCSPTFSFPFDIPNFAGPGVYILEGNNVVQVNNDGSYVFLSGGPPISTIASSSGFVLPSLSLPSLSLPGLSLPTFTFGSVTIPSYTGPGFYVPSPGNTISINSQGLLSIVSNTGIIGGATTGGFISIPSITLPQITLPTVTLPGGYVVSNYRGPGSYTIQPGTVIEVDLFGSVSFIQGAPLSTNINTSGFVLPTLSFPSIVLPTISLPRISSSNIFGSITSASPLTSNPALLPLKTTINNITYSFPFNVPNFYGPGLYVLNSGVLQVNRDSTYSFVTGGPPKARRNRLEAVDEKQPSTSELATASESSGFVLPGFSFSGFSRRAEPSSSEYYSREASEESNHRDHAGFLSSVLALF
ncbi:hypothetical protein CU098_013054 [Rhizopus stolonifer]|uniref:Uncharacterized protein n=1 Tax=Rhizopus stolonifer TaxID=4846 RepID=A0A367KW40_RHIST|nr:hypothetical protein CU098_013054 [Rhizopus stolonifer]